MSNPPAYTPKALSALAAIVAKLESLRQERIERNRGILVATEQTNSDEASHEPKQRTAHR